MRDSICMKPLFLYTLTSFILNLAAILALLVFAGEGSLEGLLFNIVLIGSFLLIESVVAIFMLYKPVTKITGQAILFSIAIIFLIGFSLIWI